MKWKEITIGALVSLAVIVIGLFIEYRSGLFHPTGSKRDRSIFEPLRRAFTRLLGWLRKQRRYIFLVLFALLLIALELVLYGLAGWKLVAVSFAHLFLVMPLVLLLFAPRQATGDLILTIDFDYHPEPPTKRGWVVAVGKAPEFALADYYGSKALAIQKVDRYALDYHVKCEAAKFIEFVAKYKPEGVVYAHIDAQSKDHSTSPDSWIQIKIGRREPKKHERLKNEWIIWVTPTKLEGNWQLFQINLITEFKRTFGTEGKSFEGLTGFRLRGNLELAYIAVFE